MRRVITEQMLEQYENYLYEDEKRPATIKKYIRDVKKLQEYADGEEISKRLLIEYKRDLLEKGTYKERSINSFLVSANCFLQFMGWDDAKVKLNRIQKEIFSQKERNLTREDYKKLVRTAKELGRSRMAMILQTICATGMRVGELKYVTVRAVEKGMLEIRNKGKSRKVFLPNKLRVSLKRYIRQNGISDGIVFITSGGREVDRSNIWREMKRLCKSAGVAEKKVFPHNLRHLFARTYYSLEKDLSRLADILGHSAVTTTRIYTMESGKIHAKQINRLGLVLDTT